MKHKIAVKENLGSHNWVISIKLIPENDLERKAIKNVEIAEATDSERELIDNWLLHSLPSNYSLVNLISQVGDIFLIKAYLN